MVYLKSILKNGFFPHYCPEYRLDPDDKAEASKGCRPLHAAPLVSFCDLPLSLIRNHLKEYGNYGIGLKKNWGLRNGVTPVMYTHYRARTRRPILRLTASAKGRGDKRAANDLDLLAAYTKPFRGAAWRENRRKKLEGEVRFYDEREWRYVPVVREDEPLFLNRDHYTRPNITKALHRRFRKEYALPIHPDDIQYLIVPNDGHILALHKYLKRLYTPKDAVLVTTAIMTIDCIHEDV